MLTPAALRAMRAALNWSVRDLAAHAGVAPGTVVTMERGADVSARSRQRVVKAFRDRGISVIQRGKEVSVRIASPRARSKHTPPALHDVPYLAVKPRADGSARVLFSVPARLRPPGWPPNRPLPVHGRTGQLDEAEVAAIKVDAARFLAELERARLLCAQNRR